MVGFIAIGKFSSNYGIRNIQDMPFISNVQLKIKIKSGTQSAQRMRKGHEDFSKTKAVARSNDLANS
jgi:hypothetical protein